MPDGAVVNDRLSSRIFIGNNRPSVLIEMQRAVRFGRCYYSIFSIVDELKTFVTVEGTRVADHKRHSMMILLWVWDVGMYVLNFDMDTFGFDNEKTKKMLDAILKTKQ